MKVSSKTLLLVTAAVVAGCSAVLGATGVPDVATDGGVDGETDAGETSYATVAAFCQAVAAAECQEASTCDVDAAQCLAYRTAQCNGGTLVYATPGSDTLSRAYAPSKAPACISALKSAFAGSVRVTFTQLYAPGALVDTCEAAFVGSQGSGATCQTSYDCDVSGQSCSPVAGQSGGRCATPSTRALGASCADPGDVCPSGSYCQSQAGTPECVATLALGAACTADAQCGTAGYCGGGKCVPLGGPGASCADNNDCATTAPLCDLAAMGGSCETGLQFAPGAFDCTGYLLGSGGGSGADGGRDGGEAGACPAPTLFASNGSTLFCHQDANEMQLRCTESSQTCCLGTNGEPSICVTTGVGCAEKSDIPVACEATGDCHGNGQICCATGPAPTLNAACGVEEESGLVSAGCVAGTTCPKGLFQLCGSTTDCATCTAFEQMDALISLGVCE